MACWRPIMPARNIVKVVPLEESAQGHPRSMPQELVGTDDDETLSSSVLPATGQVNLVALARQSRQGRFRRRRPEHGHHARRHEREVMIRVVGSINLDLIANVERLPMAGETVHGTGFSTAPGGKGANQALAARRAGAEVAMTGAVGGDAHAGQALELLQQAGIDWTGVRTAQAPTGIALILVDAKGQNQITVVSGANGEVGVDMVPAFSAGDVGVAATGNPAFNGGGGDCRGASRRRNLRPQYRAFAAGCRQIAGAS